MFSATRPLPLTISTLYGESATSFASRLARRNGVPRMITFCSDVGIDYFALVNGDPIEIQRLAVLGGVDAHHLQVATPHLIAPSWFRLGQETVKFTGFIRTTLRICPRCLREAAAPLDVIHHGIWQLAAIRTCARHGCHLVAVPKPKNGNDGFDHIPMLEGFEPNEAIFAAEDQLELERYVTRRISGRPRRTWLDSLPLHVAAQTCEMFGALLTLGPQMKRAALDDTQWVAAGTAGLKILHGGPESLCTTLKEIQNNHAVGEKLYRSHYGIFFDWLRSRNDDGDFDVVRDIVRDFIFKNFPVTTGSIVLGKPCPEQQVHSFTTTQQIFGISHHKLGRKLANIGMARLHSSGRFYVLEKYLPNALMIEICAEVNALLGAKEAAKILGIHYVLLDRLASQGLVKKHYDDDQDTAYYNRADIDQFVNNLRTRTRRTVEGEQYVPIGVAARLRGEKVAPLTEKILTIGVQLYSEREHPTGFREFLINSRDLVRFHARKRAPILSSKEICGLLKINRRTVYCLQETGVLQGAPQTRGQWVHRGRYSTAVSVEKFHKEFISTDELIEVSGRSRHAEYFFQIKKGVKPLALVKRCSKIYRRSDVS